MFSQTSSNKQIGKLYRLKIQENQFQQKKKRKNELLNDKKNNKKTIKKKKKLSNK